MSKGSFRGASWIEAACARRRRGQSQPTYRDIFRDRLAMQSGAAGPQASPDAAILWIGSGSGWSGL